MSNITLNPYIFFKGNCREAMEFYKSIFGGELTVQTYGDVNTASEQMPAENIMHAMLQSEEFTVLGSDTAAASPTAAKITLCLGGSDKEKLTNIFNHLSDGVEIKYPLKKEFWGDTFGSLTDKYGVEWMVNISEPKNNS